MNNMSIFKDRVKLEFSAWTIFEHCFQKSWSGNGPKARDTHIPRHLMDGKTVKKASSVKWKAKACRNRQPPPPGYIDTPLSHI